MRGAIGGKGGAAGACLFGAGTCGDPVIPVAAAPRYVTEVRGSLVPPGNRPWGSRGVGTGPWGGMDGTVGARDFALFIFGVHLVLCFYRVWCVGCGMR